MKKITTILCIILICGCSGKTAKIDNTLFESPKITEETQQKPMYVTNEGINYYQGRPSTLVFAVWSVSVDLASIQKHAGQIAMGEVPPKTKVESFITNFKYKWPAFSFNTKAIVTFDLHTRIIKDNETVDQRTFSIIEFEGSDSKIFLEESMPFGFAWSEDKDERSKMVAIAVFEAIFPLYKQYFTKI